MGPFSIGSINLLTAFEKRAIYARIIPSLLLDWYHLSPFLVDQNGNDLLKLVCRPGTSSLEISLFHKFGFPDPILYGHLTDTITGKIHILLYIINNPDSPRFHVDRMSDGSSTKFGTVQRNLAEEEKALAAGLAPGQVRRGLRILSQAIARFEQWLESLGQEIYFAEPLYYHNAVLFEKHGFTYQTGLALMQSIQRGFLSDEDLHQKLDGSTPFRSPSAAASIRLRSWAIHDGILGSPFSHVTMYKNIHHQSTVTTCPNIPW